MAFDSIKAGLKVITRTRIGRTGKPRGGVEGVIHAVIQHPVTRQILAVIVAPEGATADQYVVASPGNLKAA